MTRQSKQPPRRPAAPPDQPLTEVERRELEASLSRYGGVLMYPNIGWGPGFEQPQPKHVLDDARDKLAAAEATLVAHGFDLDWPHVRRAEWIETGI